MDFMKVIVGLLLLLPPLIIVEAAIAAQDYEVEFGETTHYMDTTESYEETTGNFQASTSLTAVTKRPVASDDDVIELNVGGQRITTLRSTLTAVPQSKLALMFVKHQNISTDKQGAAFFDYNPIDFTHLLNQLRAIKREPNKPPYEINIQAPTAEAGLNFSEMIRELGLNPDRFLFPMHSVYLNLNVTSLFGWKRCHRSLYDTPFDIFTLINNCKSTRLLIACRPVGNNKTFTLAGIGKRADLFHRCTSSSCSTNLKNNIGYYYVENQAWGFEGRPENINQQQFNHHYNNGQSRLYLSPCDTSDHLAEYRLCWSLRSSVSRGGGDRCGSMKNLHNGTGWERLIYEAI